MDGTGRLVLIIFAAVVVAVLFIRQLVQHRRVMSAQREAQRCPECGEGTLAERGAWSWSVSESGELMLVSWGDVAEPDEELRARMIDDWPELSLWAFEQCDGCHARLLREESHSFAERPLPPRRRPCPEDLWRRAG